MLTHTAGVDGITAAAEGLTVTGRTIRVDNVSADSVSVSDLTGRILATGNARGFSYEVTAGGVYVIRIGGKSFKKAIL